MDSDGVLVDKGRKLLGVSNEEILSWYKNMLTGVYYWLLCRGLLLIILSECDGRGNVRGPKTGPSKFLHGMRTRIGGPIGKQPF
jgi:hypothetical protein